MQAKTAAGFEEAATSKGYKGLGMEGAVANWYAKTTRKDLADFQALARETAATLAPGAKFLEVAPGPGYLAIELAKLGNYEIAGLDISKTFVEIATRNAKEAGVRVDFRQGDAAHMPFADSTFDRIACRAAFKNFSDPVGALREMRRVLVPGGRAVIIDLSKDAKPEAIDAYVDKGKRGAVESFMMKWTFRLMLLKRAYTRKDFEGMIAQSGFGAAEIREADLGFEITLTK